MVVVATVLLAEVRPCAALVEEATNVLLEAAGTLRAVERLVGRQAAGEEASHAVVGEGRLEARVVHHTVAVPWAEVALCEAAVGHSQGHALAEVANLVVAELGLGVQEASRALGAEEVVLAQAMLRAEVLAVDPSLVASLALVVWAQRHQEV
mmetsp:Transcript_66990/g.160506  ORF Transcript_66990/g.160506 Transcript_66990/m.160506 type:complete len:152 (-) Transcript_66990:1424-1879(-)